MTATSIEKLIETYFTVLSEVDTIKICSIALLPQGFYEPEAADLKLSFFKFLNTDKLQKAELESIQLRVELKYYDSIYKIYHDLTVISIILLSKFKIGDPVYNKIDQFYLFAVELLLQELSKVGLGIGHDNGVITLTEFEQKVMKDFALITSFYDHPNRELLFVLGNRNTLLFSSLLQKSTLDERETLVDLPFLKVVVPPQQERLLPAANVLGNLSPATPLIPEFLIDQIAEGITHPNWFGLQASKWLKHSGDDIHMSFLPSVDGSKGVISKDLKGLVWIQQVGNKNVKKLEDVVMSESNGVSNDVKPEEHKAEADELNNETTETIQEPRESKQLNLKLILTYDPKLDEEYVLSSLLSSTPNTPKLLQSKINKLLIQLNKLSKLPLRNLKHERRLYFQLEKLLTLVISNKDVTPAQLELELSTKIPVTQTNYAGTLPALAIASAPPGVLPQANAAAQFRGSVNGSKSTRLSSINKKYRR